MICREVYNEVREGERDGGKERQRVSEGGMNEKIVRKIGEERFNETFLICMEVYDKVKEGGNF